MGWVDEDDTDVSRFPVDDFVQKIRNALNDIDSVCYGYSGQVRSCCDDARSCFADLENSLATMKLAAVGNQSMHKACRTFSEKLESVKDCLTGISCHWSVNTSYVIGPFDDYIATLETLKEENCSNLPPEQTTITFTTVTTTMQNTTTSSTTSTTKPPPTTTTEVPSTTTTNKISPVTVEETTPDEEQTTSVKPQTTTPKSITSSSISSSEITQSGSTSTTGSIGSTISSSTIGHQEVSTSDLGNTIIIVSSVIGVVLLLTALVIFIVIRKRKQNSEKSDSGGTFESQENQKPTLLRRLFQKSKTKQPPHGDNEIYAEIDEAFMEAVYKSGNEKQKPKKEALRERLSSNTQVNVCYEATFDDNIINSKDSLERGSLSEQSLSMVSLHPLAVIRKEDDAITSFQTDQSNDQRQNSVPLSNQKKGFVISKPSFTDIRSNEPDYVYIDARANEPIYAVPSTGESEYDTADYGRNPLRNISQAPENIYSSVGQYTNIEETSAASVYDHTRFKEYRRSDSDVNVSFYENQDTMMEY